MNTSNCEKCGQELQVGDFPYCPHGRGTGVVVGDDIPGGLLIEHGLCDEKTGKPVRYYTKSDIAREAKARGLQNVVRHIEGSKHTSRWV